MLDISQLKPKHKFFLYRFHHNGAEHNGGFIGERAEDVFDTEPLASLKDEVESVDVMQVDLDTFLKDMTVAGKNAPEFQYYDWEYYKNRDKDVS